MKRFVNGDEVDLAEGLSVSITRFGDRQYVRTEAGTYSALVVRQGETTWVSYRGRQYRVEKKPARNRAGATSSNGELRAPMPGSIVDVRVSVGANVAKGDVILVLEAMKTQQPFSAPFDGVVKEIFVRKGEQVLDGMLMATVVSLLNKR